MVAPFNFLGKDITVKKIDGSHIRGFCINENDEGILINPKEEFRYSDKFVFIPKAQISEIFYEEAKR